MKEIARATLNRDANVMKGLIKTYLKAQGVTPVQEIVFNIASAVFAEQSTMIVNTIESSKSNDGQLDLGLEEVGDELNEVSSKNTKNLSQQGSKYWPPKSGSSGREDGRLVHGNNMETGLRPMLPDTLGRSLPEVRPQERQNWAPRYGSGAREDERLLYGNQIEARSSWPLPDPSGRSFPEVRSQGRPDLAPRYGSGAREDERLMRGNSMEAGSWPGQDTSGRSFPDVRSQGRQDWAPRYGDTSGRSLDEALGYGSSANRSVPEARSEPPRYGDRFRTSRFESASGPSAMGNNQLRSPIPEKDNRNSNVDEQQRMFKLAGY